MIDYNPVTNEYGNCIAVGRGAIAIRLALEKIDKRDKKILVPSNICYAAVLPIIYAGYTPIFCDVNCRSGNITYDIIKQYNFDNIGVAIIPHMYGNPVLGMKEIVFFLHSQNVVVIEDCASLMSREGDEYIPGTLGDFIIYSTGYSKTIDIGFGGLLFSKHYNLDAVEKLEQKMPRWRDDYKNEWKDFSHIYRILRNNGQQTKITMMIYQNLPNALKESYYYSISYEDKKRIFASIENLNQIVQERRRQYNMYKDLLENYIGELYAYDPKAVPWRFNIFVNNHKAFVQYCLENNLPISDWYPRVTPIFACKSEFVGAKWHEEHIVNFPLLVEDNKIKNICRIINKFNG